MSAPRRRAGSTFEAQGRGRLQWLIVDAASILALLALVALAFYPVYGTGWLFVTVLGFGAVGIAAAIVSARWRLAPGLTAAVAAAGWFLFGGLLAMPSSTVGYVIPTPRTLFGLLVGPVTAWRDMLTLEPPIGETFNLLTVPGVVALLAGLLGMLLSLRTRRPMLAWVPPGLGYLVGVAVGSQVGYRPFLVGAAFFLIVLLWTSHRRAVARGQLSDTPAKLKPLRLALALATVATAGAVTFAVVPALAGSAERASLRALVEPPIDLDRYASPLQGFRANISDHESTPLFDVAGARPGDIVRVATLDKYDGLSYRVSTLDDAAVEATTFTRVGQWIDDDTDGDDLDVSVVVRGYTGVWAPTLGRTTQVRFDGERRIALSENFFYNRSSGTGIVSVGLQEGDRYELGARVAPRPSQEQIAQLAAGEMTLPASRGVPDRLLTLAHEWGGDAPTAGQAAIQLEERLQLGWFSHGQEDQTESLSGHTEDRLNRLLADTDRMVGDGEQYAVAMALMARELGIPARVIYGYRVGDTPQITGADVGAWPELYFAGAGWVTFDPTPSDERELPDELNAQPPEPQSYVENPPPPPLRPEVPPSDEQLPVDPGEAPDQEDRIDWAQIGALAALTGIPLITIVVPISLILGLKMRRRARRRNNPVMANRIAGAWSELVDRARDMGRSPSASATRSEQAESLIREFPKLRDNSDPIALAKEADWIVFAPGDPSEATTKDYWSASSAIRRGMRRSTNALRWIASYLSTKSFRRIK